MLERRENLKIVSKLGFGFFSGWGLSSQLFDLNSLLGITGTVVTAWTSAVALAYLEYCSHDPTHRKMGSLENFLNFMLEKKTVWGSYFGGLANLAMMVKGNDISYSNAMLILSLTSGVICEALSNNIREDGTFRNDNVPRP